MGRKKKDLDDAFFADFEEMEPSGDVKDEAGEEPNAAPGKYSLL
jgi:hypothetical protein